MPVKKQPKPSLEACQKLWALIVTAKDLSPNIERELLGHVYAIWPGRRRSILHIWAYPEIHRLVNGMGTLPDLPPGKRFKVKSASRMMAKVMIKLADKPTEKIGEKPTGKLTEKLRVGYLGWLRKPSEERDYALDERKLYELRLRERHGTRAKIAGGV
jgi:hypothetical protein